MTVAALINIDVDDRDGAIAFYTRAFDLQVSRRLGASVIELTGATAPIYLLVKAADTMASPAAGDRRRYRRHWTPVHIDFVVADLEAAVARAQAAGASLDDPPSTHVWGKIAHLADPFGNGFCLVEFLGRGYDEIVTG